MQFVIIFRTYKSLNITSNYAIQFISVKLSNFFRNLSYDFYFGISRTYTKIE